MPGYCSFIHSERKFEEVVSMCEEMLSLDPRDKTVTAKMNVKKAEAYSKMAVVLSRKVGSHSKGIQGNTDKLVLCICMSFVCHLHTISPVSVSVSVSKVDNEHELEKTW